MRDGSWRRGCGICAGSGLWCLACRGAAVPVAFEVARALGAPLDVIVVRKLGVPFQPELGMGAIGEDGVRVLNQEIIQWGGISADELAAVEARERREVERRAFRYRRGRPRQPVGGCVAVVVDDGIATGSTARAACQVARAQGAARVFDLLTPDEEAYRANVFDIGLLARRLTGVTRWLRAQPATAGLPVGYFGASTGAAAALWAAAEPGSGIAAVVSRGGLPDLASPRLGAVRAPTLLIVGGHDDVVLGLNRQAQAGLRCENPL